MKNLWDQGVAKQFEEDSLQMRVYSSNLLGQNTDLVLHGGGNTSVKLKQTNLFGEEEVILYVKGSGWNLATIEAAGFSALRLDSLQKLAKLENISDAEMIRQQQIAMINPDAPSPSVEALLHAIIPFSWIDHTHADAVVTISNTDKGEKLLRDLYGERLIVIPYVLPGFKLAQTVLKITEKLNCKQYEGMLLLNHGIISFAESARESYTRMIDLVSQAEKYLNKYNSVSSSSSFVTVPENADSQKQVLQTLARIRRKVSEIRGSAMLAQLDNNSGACNFAGLANVKEIATRGPITSDHLIRTKPIPLIVDAVNPDRVVDEFAAEYTAYFERNSNGHQSCLDCAPRWAVWPESTAMPAQGTISFGKNLCESEIVADIVEHTLKAIQQAERLGGWNPVAETHLFEAEYWELQQAKLTNNSLLPVEMKALEFEGKIALVSGAASGIGLACARELREQGAVVVGLDLNPEIVNILSAAGMMGLECNVTDQEAVRKAVEETVRKFGGLDILVLNAGTFPAGQTIEEMDEKTWSKSLAINLTAPQQLLQACVPFLKEGIEPAVVFMASRNVPAPGPGASAYSVPKAGQTQLARIAAMELGKFGIRVNILHPDCVYDTGLWTPEALERSAKRYGLTVEEYKGRNVLKIDVKTKEVARMVCAMAGSVFAKTTGAQIPIDGGNERVI
ncbi:MAG: bifunctional aldolase/short-chain dehydrogenase [SAR324 cluster bacterium]|nr:bifunctional aldolase/short-chain dehydrogenase [SAR324 cluster bacterium]MBL7034519.1 bifunctional aldolase/short-chain dehydrogenase [SAR324 cluster bacterium]